MANQDSAYDLSSRREMFGIFAGTLLIYPGVLFAQSRNSKKPTLTKLNQAPFAATGSLYEACMAACESQYYACRGTVNRSGKSAVWKASIGYPGCMTAWIACHTECRAAALGNAISAAADWIAANPGAVIGTIVVIGGITFIVVSSGGGAIALAPVLAL